MQSSREAGEGVLVSPYIMQRNGFLKNAAVLSLGGFVAKGIGALARISLTAILGGYGMGLYQMAYPLFVVLLTFSSAGIPTALSRLVAEEIARGGEGRETLFSSFRMFALLGLSGTVLMALLSPFLSAAQGEHSLTLCYLALAPSVFLVALIAVLRGYFQGKREMTPTAVSEILEQLVKAGAGLYAAGKATDPVFAVAAALFAVSLSEGAALFYLFMRYRMQPPCRMLRARRRSGSLVLSSAFPVMAASSLLPLSKMADSVVIVRLLSLHSEKAVSLYGLFAGGASSLVSLPATVCYGLAAASVPAVSALFARGKEEEGKNAALSVLILTLLLSVPCAAGLFFFARPIVRLLFPSLAEGERAVLVSLVRLSSVSAATLAGVDTLSACLAGMGRAKHAALSMLLAVLVKFALQLFLVKDPALSIGGAAIAANVCYLVAFFLDLFYTVRKQREVNYDNSRELGRSAGRSDPAGA